MNVMHAKAAPLREPSRKCRNPIRNQSDAYGRSDIGLPDGRTDGARAREAQLDSNEEEEEE